MKNIKKMLCVLFAIVTVMTSIFTVNTQAKALKTTQVESVSILTTGIRIKWTAVKGVSGYQIQLARSKDFKKAKKTFNVAKPNASAKKLINKDLKSLKPYKRYYVRIRTYKKSGKKTAYSKWSAVKNFKTPNLIELEDHTYVVCTTNDNHSMPCGNIGRWFNSRADVQTYAKSQADQYYEQYKEGFLTWEEYGKKAGYGYEAWNCAYCGEWTGNIKYH